MTMGKAGEKHRTASAARALSQAVPPPPAGTRTQRGGWLCPAPSLLHPALTASPRHQEKKNEKEQRRIAATSTMISRSSLSSSCKPLLAPPAQTTRDQRLQGPSTSGLPGFDVTSSSTFKADLLGPFMKACRLCGKDALSLLLLSILSFLDSTF